MLALVNAGAGKKGKDDDDVFRHNSHQRKIYLVRLIYNSHTYETGGQSFAFGNAHKLGR